MSISPAHMEQLRSAAISDEVLESSGIRSTPTGLAFPWTDGKGPVQWQSKPDSPAVDADGRPIKYVFPKGARMVFNRLRDGDAYERLILAEGTKQQYTVLSHAPKDCAVYGMSGCWNWNDADLTVAWGREVFLLFDGDLETNTGVYQAAEELTKQLKRNGASSVKYVLTTARDKEGVDDVLSAVPDAERARLLKLWLTQATERMPKRPRKKRRDVGGANPERFFHQSDKPLKLSVADAVEDLLKDHPAAVTRENTVAMYTNGFYQVNSNAFIAALTEMFGNLYTPGIRQSMEEYSRGYLYRTGKELPERAKQRLLNCSNGMLDLMTGELHPHDPKYLSCTQIPVAWDADATCPTYAEWIVEAVGSQVEDLEEVIATMLDPTRTPTKALFAYGPSRSGKSTLLRIIKAIAGHRNTSAVTLHQIAEDKFAAANIYGKMLNVAADLSSRHVDDLSVFKMLTGEDEVSANRKYGSQFTYTNQALFAFSANELPTVSESSRAYSERIKPFEFPNSFAGREDLSLESRLMEELPGILVRWVAAWRRFNARGGYQATAAAVREQFEARSDRVVQFVTDLCDVHPAQEGARMDPAHCTGRRDVAFAFNQWAKRNGGAEMGERKIFERLRNITGITEVRGVKGARAFNLIVRDVNEDRWEDDVDHVAAVWAAQDAVAVTAPQEAAGPVLGVLDPQAVAIAAEGPSQDVQDVVAKVARQIAETSEPGSFPGYPGLVELRIPVDLPEPPKECCEAPVDHHFMDCPTRLEDPLPGWGDDPEPTGPSLHFGADDRYRESFK